MILEDIDADLADFNHTINDFGNTSVIQLEYQNEPVGRAILSREREGWLRVQVEMLSEYLRRHFDLYMLRVASDIADNEDRAIQKTVTELT